MLNTFAINHIHRCLSPQQFFFPCLTHTCVHMHTCKWQIHGHTNSNFSTRLEQFETVIIIRHNTIYANRQWANQSSAELPVLQVHFTAEFASIWYFTNNKIDRCCLFFLTVLQSLSNLQQMTWPSQCQSTLSSPLSSATMLAKTQNCHHHHCHQHRHCTQNCHHHHCHQHRHCINQQLVRGNDHKHWHFLLHKHWCHRRHHHSTNQWHVLGFGRKHWHFHFLQCGNIANLSVTQMQLHSRTTFDRWICWCRHSWPFWLQVF